MRKKRTLGERASIDWPSFSSTYFCPTGGCAASIFLGFEIFLSLLCLSEIQVLSVFVTFPSSPAFVVASFSSLPAAAGCAPPPPQSWLPSHAGSLPALVS